jgi:hypothetical protein
MPNNLPESLKDIEDKYRPRRRHQGAYRSDQQARKAAKKANLGRTSIYFDVRDNKRRPPPVPEGLTLEEIKELDPDDPRFRHSDRNGVPHDGHRDDLWSKREPETWKDHIAKERQDRAKARRAKVRKSEAVIVKAVQDKGIVRGSVKNPGENTLIAEEILDLDDWDEEELIRGYRRNRKGRFGKPPVYIPREVQQACWRRLVKLGDKKMKDSYLEILENMLDFARGYRFDENGQRVELEISDKIQMQAMKEVMDRLIGKIPDTLKVQAEAPYEAFLADAVQPIEEEEPELIERTVTSIGGQRITMEIEDGDDRALPAGTDEPRRRAPKKRAKRSSSSSTKKTSKTRRTAAGGSVKASKKKSTKKRKKRPKEKVYEGELVE